MARQYRIVNPEASDEDVERMVESGETQVFSQAVTLPPSIFPPLYPPLANKEGNQQLLSSGRSREAHSVNAAVRERQAEIQRIESTLIELLTLFEQMAEQVVLDEPKIMQVEDNASKVERDIETANTHLGKGVESAIATRRKKWICLGIGVGIVVVIAVIITVVVLVRRNNNNNNNNNSNPPAPTATK